MIQFLLELDYRDAGRARRPGKWLCEPNNCKFTKFNHAILSIKESKFPMRLVLRNDNKRTTVFVREPKLAFFAEQKVRSFIPLKNGLFVHKTFIRKTSRRRTRKQNEDS